MPKNIDQAGRRPLLSSGLTGLTGLAGAACAACCAIPLMLAAGVLSGAGWAAVGRSMPAVAVVLAALAVAAWWWVDRRPHSGCAGASGCANRTSEQPNPILEPTGCSCGQRVG
jgi:mercuric ion transport protein